MPIDQVKLPPISGLFRSLGRFRFEAGKTGSLTISTEGTREYVIADAAQFIPVGLLESEDTKAMDAALKKQRQAAGVEKRVKSLQAKRDELKKHAPPPAPMAMAATDKDKPADCNICVRGEPHNHGSVAPRGFLAVTRTDRDPVIRSDTSGRLALAHWIADAGNPLTARVIVNRIWHHLFGAGLVRTVDNFGKLGDRPTHPDLLDQLAVDFVADGWSVKRMVRRIVLSRVYRLSADSDPRAAAVDPDNRLRWRQNRRRLSAESIRDGILCVAGSLDRTAGVSPVADRSEQAIANNPKNSAGKGSFDQPFKRSVYLPMVRNDIPHLLTIFDFADPDVGTGARSVTTVPAQALFLMNSPFVRGMARRLANSLFRNDGLDDHQRLDLLYVRTVGRPPTYSERRRALRYITAYEPTDSGDGKSAESVDRQAWTSVAQAILASTEFRFLD